MMTEQKKPVTTTDAGIPAPSPERVVHAKGTGAFGYFEVTEDVTGWTRAAFLSPLKENLCLRLTYA